jgi:hypothetical protein
VRNAARGDISGWWWWLELLLLGMVEMVATVSSTALLATERRCSMVVSIEPYVAGICCMLWFVKKAYCMAERWQE